MRYQEPYPPPGYTSPYSAAPPPPYEEYPPLPPPQRPGYQAYFDNYGDPSPPTQIVDRDQSDCTSFLKGCLAACCCCCVLEECCL